MTDTQYTLPITVQGLMTSFKRSHLPAVGHAFIATELVTERQWGGRNNGAFMTTPVDKSILQFAGEECIVGAGAIKFLSQRNPFIKIQVENSYPADRGNKVLNAFEVPAKLMRHKNFLLNGKPREYFYEALEACRTNPLGTVKLPPQSGKTSIMMTLAHNLMKQVGCGLLIVSNAAQREQMIRRADEYGVSHVYDYEEFVDRNIKEDNNYTLIITPQMFASRLKSGEFHYYADKFKWIILDECHHVKSASEQKLFYVCTNLIRGYGFSATPTKKEVPTGAFTFNKMEYDDAVRISYLGPIIYERSTKDMIEQGSTNKTVLVNYKFRWDPEDVSVLIMQFNTLGMGMCNLQDYSHLLKLLCMNQRRMDLISDIQNVLVNSDRNTMLNVARKEYGYTMLEKLKRSDTVCWYGSGKVFINNLVMAKLRDFNAKEIKTIATSNQEFKNIYQSKVMKGDDVHIHYGGWLRSIISTSSVGSEGISFDKPVNAVILSEGKGSNTITTIQRAGRTSGTHTNKVSVIINIYDEGCSNILNKHASTRSASIKKEYGINKAYTIDNLIDLQNLLQQIDKEN